MYRCVDSPELKKTLHEATKLADKCWTIWKSFYRKDRCQLWVIGEAHAK